MISYRTETGSIYDVDGMMVRRRVRSQLSQAERVTAEWKEAVAVDFKGVGSSLVIHWPETEEKPAQLRVVIGGGSWSDIEMAVFKTTVTSKVVEILDPPILE